jgi:hypothetical protein
MDPVLKKSKKKARKTGGEAQPARQTEVNYSTGKYTSSRDEEELVVDYELEEPPARFSPVEEEISFGADDKPDHGDGSACAPNRAESCATRS